MDLSSLNTAQREAVEYIDGPSLVIAGAGSGKTRVLTYKIAYLLSMGVKPWNILALTFTNKAANEMKERISLLAGSEARYLNMGTFHSVFSRILRSEAAAIGYNSQFTIYDESDSRSLIKTIIKEMSLDDKVYKPATVHNHISMAKNCVELPSDYAMSPTYQSRDRDARMEHTAKIYEIYQQRLHQANAMDFDDLLLYTYILFRDHEDIRKKYSERYQYVLVDEYQDTNAVQHSIVHKIVKDHLRVCVVGDDAQSIYGFRGANIDNILEYQKQFAAPDLPVRLFKLEQNYRSTQTIVAAANSLIEHNSRRIHKNVYSRNPDGQPLLLRFCYSDREEAIIVCKDIMRLRRSEGLKYSDFAILYRTNAQSRTFEEQLRKDAIPYKIIGGLSFYQRKEIKDVIAYFRLVVNPYDEEALRRIINYPTRGIGNTTVEKIMQQARTRNVAPWDIVQQPLEYGLPVAKAAMNKLMAFASMINTFAQDAESDAHTLGMKIVKESGISAEIYSGKEPDDLSRQENLQELLDSIQEFVDSRSEETGDEHIALSDFLQEVSLMSDIDSDEDTDDKVVLMTIHSAKGLEFPAVFIVGMEENIFPSPMSSDSIRGIEEERRLLYVAITRAERFCTLTCAHSRYRYGQMQFDTPSRFLREIDSRYMRRSDANGENTSTNTSTYRKPSQPQPRPQQPHPQPETTFTRTGRRLVPVGTRPAQRPLMSSTPSMTRSTTFALSVGDRVEHQRFGQGTVLKIDGTGENTKAVVEFTNAGTKQLLLKFAKLVKL